VALRTLLSAFIIGDKVKILIGWQLARSHKVLLNCGMAFLPLVLHKWKARITPRRNFLSLERKLLLAKTAQVLWQI